MHIRQRQYLSINDCDFMFEAKPRQAVMNTWATFSVPWHSHYHLCHRDASILNMMWSLQLAHCIMPDKISSLSLLLLLSLSLSLPLYASFGRRPWNYNETSVMPMAEVNPLSPRPCQARKPCSIGGDILSSSLWMNYWSGTSADIFRRLQGAHRWLLYILCRKCHLR